MSVTVDYRRYDPFAAEMQQNPFPWYAALREHAPIWRHPASGIVLVSRHGPVSQILADTETYSSRFASQPTAGSREANARIQAIMDEGFPRVSTMLTEDPPLQTRYRKTVGKALSTRRILALEGKIRELSDEILRAWPARGRVDVMHTLSIPLPIRVIGHFLCMRPEVFPHVKRWSDASVAGLGVIITDDERIAAARSVVEMQKYWQGELEARLTTPNDDILSALTQAEFEDETGTERRLEMPEMISIIQQLMVAGNETTTKVINETLKLLLENPRWFARMQSDSGVVAAVVEEALRLSSPNQGMFRFVTRDTELDGVAIAKGTMIWLMFGSANRDDTVFPDPDAFDPGRPNLKESVAFGRGAHFCIGAPLARLELRVLFEQIARRVESFALPAGYELAYEPSYILRGLAGLELDVVTRAA
ncbi:MAG TPA: cytochrome P450 [Myxococcota bacterium]|jgi:cytochrome P450